MNRWDFRCRRNDDRVDVAVTVGGRLFQAVKSQTRNVSLAIISQAEHSAALTMQAARGVSKSL